MKDTPPEFNGPFTLHDEQGHHVIRGADGVSIAELTQALYITNNDSYPDGVIRSRVARTDEAQFVVDAMNFLYLSLKDAP